MSAPTGTRLALARRIAAGVLDPELPVLTLADLGVLRAVERDAAGGLIVTITPTYTGCPALAEMRADLVAALAGAGFDRVEVRTVLAPAWTTDWITGTGRAKLTAAGIAPPGPAPRAGAPTPLNLAPPAPRVRCPRCGSVHTEQLARFGPTACTALRRCLACTEPFEHLKEL